MKQKQPSTKIFDVMTHENYEKNREGFKHGEMFIQCETKLELNQEAIDAMKGMVLHKKTKRNTPILLKNFKQEGGLFKFEIGAPISKSFFDVYNEVDSHKTVGTTFVDFCWVVSEGTTAKNVIEVDTPFRKDAVMGDLTYVLPSKFADDLIEAMHSLNLEFFEGILSDTILYGPYFFYKADEELPV